MQNLNQNHFRDMSILVSASLAKFTPKYLTPQERKNPPLPTRISRFVGTSGQNGIALRHQWTNAANIGYKASNINFFPIFCNVDLLAHSAVVGSGASNMVITIFLAPNFFTKNDELFTKK